MKQNLPRGVYHLGKHLVNKHQTIKFNVVEEISGASKYFEKS